MVFLMIRKVNSYQLSFPAFAKYAWFVLIYNLGVILWGAYVRASGSGAGCGSHWPSCNGEIIPRSPAVETIVEFSHRLSSGVALLLIIGMFLWAYRSYPKKHIARLGATFSFAFIITEALVGAGLVLFQWVADDASVGRAVSVAIHLANTFLLLAALTLTAWWASGGQQPILRGRSAASWALGLGFSGVLLLGVTGAVTALGDTLFPAGTLTEGIQQDFAPTAHFLIRLRFWHPVIALVVGFYVLFVAGYLWLMEEDRWIKLFAAIQVILFIFQLGAGLVNLVLLAPIWMQLVHLLLADLVWINLVLLSAVTLSRFESKIAAEEQIAGADYGKAGI